VKRPIWLAVGAVVLIAAAFVLAEAPLLHVGFHMSASSFGTECNQAAAYSGGGIGQTPTCNTAHLMVKAANLLLPLGVLLLAGAAVLGWRIRKARQGGAR
jgi:hypothetical protein